MEDNLPPLADVTGLGVRLSSVGSGVSTESDIERNIFAALKILSNPENLPAMINCAHGKDRTGIVTALALSCCGQSKHDIATDYAQSQVRNPARGLSLSLSLFLCHFASVEFFEI